MIPCSTYGRIGRPVHPWLRKLRVAFVPGPPDGLLDALSNRLILVFQSHGHIIQAQPDDTTDLVLTTAEFGQPMGLRQALVFNIQRRFKLHRTPTICTLVHATPERFRSLLAQMKTLLADRSPRAEEWQFPGLVRNAYRKLLEIGREGGALQALERVVQAQAMSFRVLLVVGEGAPLFAYHFDLVGGHPLCRAHDMDEFVEDTVLRMVTSESACTVSDHEILNDPIPGEVWERCEGPPAMCRAGSELGSRGFFGEPVHLAELIDVPILSNVVAEHYSEGCFSTWDPRLGALVTTVTGTARAICKGSIGLQDLAVVAGVKSDNRGCLVRPVEGTTSTPPSSEGVEMMMIDTALPWIVPDAGFGVTDAVPVIRSKLHGHRSVRAYDPGEVEFVPLDAPFYSFPVACGTDVQAEGIRQAFARAACLRNPTDTRKVAFTILPCHGVFIVEKWVAGKAPFEVLWQYIDSGALEVDSHVPQGGFTWVTGHDGRLRLHGAISNEENEP
jgi:hypothetical protein